MLALSGCSAGEVTTRRGVTVDCAIGKDAKLEAGCSVERTEGLEGQLLTIHHPDGGFRRLLVTSDGRGVVAADGADAASVTPLGDHEIEVTIAQERYHLPATVKAHSGP